MWFSVPKLIQSRGGNAGLFLFFCVFCTRNVVFCFKTRPVQRRECCWFFVSSVPEIWFSVPKLVQSRGGNAGLFFLIFCVFYSRNMAFCS